MGSSLIRYFSHILCIALALAACSGGVVGISSSGSGPAAPGPAAPDGASAKTGSEGPLNISNAMDAPMGAKSDPDAMGDICRVMPFFQLFFGKDFSTPLDPATGYPPGQSDAQSPKNVWITNDIEEKGWSLKFLVKLFEISDLHEVRLRIIKTDSAEKLVPNYCQDMAIDGLKPDGSNAAIENLHVADGEVVWIYYDRRMTIEGKEYPLTDCAKLLKNEAAYREFTRFYCLGVLGAFQFNIFLPSEFLHDRP